MLIFESTFPNDYRQGEIKQILNCVLTGKFCQIVCVPGAGKATVLRLLAHNRNLLRFHLKEKEGSIRFLYLNLLELTNYEAEQIVKFLLISLVEQAPDTDDYLVLTTKLNEAVAELVVGKQTIIFLFDHFDEFQNRLPRSFFQMLRSLRSIAKYKFAAVFATRRDLAQLSDSEILSEFYDFFIGNCVYLKIHDKVATDFLFSQIEKVFEKKLPQKDKESIMAQTGGHIKLTKVLAESCLGGDISYELVTLLKTPIISATLLEIWLALTAQEQQALRSIAQNKEPAKEALENLIKFDLLKGGEQFTFTIPLLKEFVLRMASTLVQEKITLNEDTKEITKGPNVVSDLLSPQEYRLLKFLIENEGRIIARDEVISSVWPDVKVLEGVSDEAIDQMVFRLRKKIEDKPTSPKHLITIKGHGLRFIS